jgi:hypothetical protein
VRNFFSLDALSGDCFWVFMRSKVALKRLVQADVENFPVKARRVVLSFCCLFDEIPLNLQSAGACFWVDFLFSGLLRQQVAS